MNPASSSGSGGSVYLTHLSRVRREYKLSIGQRKMTAQEQKAVSEQARGSWAEMSPEERSATEVLYKASIRRRRQAGHEVVVEQGPAPQYTANWHIGAPTCAIKPATFCHVWHSGAPHT